MHYYFAEDGTREEMKFRRGAWIRSLEDKLAHSNSCKFHAIVTERSISYKGIQIKMSATSAPTPPVPAL